MLGAGWSLNGLRAITRGPNFKHDINFAQDGYLSGDGQDGYYADGVRLLDVSTGALYTVFHTRSDDLSKYEPAGGICGDGPCAWVMTDRNGLKYTFGNTPDSQLLGSFPFNAPGSVRIWALSKVENSQGYGYEIQYEQDAGQIYPVKITYTTGGGLSRHKTVAFLYDRSGRPDKELSYATSSSVETNWRMRSINVKFEVACYWLFTCNQNVRDYIIAYSESSNSKRSLISNIEEIVFDNDGGAQVNWRYDYEWAATQISLTQSWRTAPENASWSTNYGDTIAADFNGDGKTDIVLVGDTVNYTKFTSLHLSQGTTFLDRKIPFDTSMNGRQLFDYTASTTQKFTVLGDVDGDGRTDIITSYFGNQSDSIADTPIFSPDNADHMGTRLIHLPHGVSQWSAAERDLYSGDFNGDGRTDLLLKGRNPTVASFILISGGSSGSTTFERVELGYTISDNKRLFVADFNGDGRADFAHCLPVSERFEFFMSSYGTFAAEPIAFRRFTNFSGRTIPCHTSTHGNIVDDYDHLVVGDFNGDGNADFITPYLSEIWLSDGYAFVSSGNLGGTFGPLSNVMLPADFNGDGKDDLFIYSNRYTYSHNATDPRSPILPGAQILLSNGRTFPPHSSTGPNLYVWQDSGAQWHNSVSEVSIVDANGDGKPDLLVNERRVGFDLPPPTRALSLLVSNTHHNDKIVRITHDYRVSRQIEYKPAGALANAITPLTPICTTQHGVFFCDAQKPYGNVLASSPDKAPRDLVTKVTTSALGVADTFSASYDYQNARFFHGPIDDRASLGFEKIRITDETSGNYTVNHYHQTRQFMGVLKKTQTFLADNTLISEVDNGAPAQYYCNELGCTLASPTDWTPNLPRQIRIASSTTREWENGIERLRVTRENVTYDHYGTVLVSKETRFANGLVDVQATQADVINALSPTRAIGLVYQTKVCINDCVSGTIMRAERTYFDGATIVGTVGNKLQVTKKEVMVAPSIWAGETFAHNALGQIVTATNDAGQVAAFEYEPNYGVSVVKKTITSQAKTISHSWQTDPRYGAATWEKDDIGREILRHIDARGRLTEEITKDAAGATVSRRTLQYDLDHTGSRNVTQCVHVAHNAAPSSCTRTYVDNLNRKVRTVTSSIDGVSEKFESHSIDYDAHGRIWRTSQPEVADDLTGLNGVPQKYAIRFYDSLNRLQRLENADGRYAQIQYNPYLLPNAVSSQRVTLGKLGTSDTTAKIVHNDIRGRLIRVIENAGTPQQAILDYTYSDLDQLLNVSAPQGVHTISYDPVFRWRTSVTDPAGGRTEFTYDTNLNSVAFGQVLTEIRPNSNAPMGSLSSQVTQYQYNDPWGRLTHVTKPDGSTLINEYDNSAVNFGKHALTKRTYSTGGYTLEDTFSYNARGQNSGSHRQISHATQNICPDGPNTLPCSSSVTAEYDELGRLQAGLLSDGTISEFEYLAGSSLVHRVKNGGHIYAEYSGYNRFGQPEAVLFGNAILHEYSYNPDNGSLESMMANKGSTELLSYTYSFDARLNLQTIIDGVVASGHNNLSYTYDQKDRVRTARRGASAVQNFQFDSSGPTASSRGNLLVKGKRIIHYAASGSATTLPTSDEIFDSYSFSWIPNQTFEWSAAGNLMRKGAATYAYNSDDKMSESHDPATGDAEYHYDASGQRFLKIFKRTGLPAIKTWYVDRTIEIREKWSPDLLTRHASQQTKYIYGLDGKRLVAKTGSVTLASTQITTQYYALASMASGKSVPGLALKVTYSFLAFVSDTPKRRVAFAILMLVVAFLICRLLESSSDQGPAIRHKRGWRQVIAAPLIMVFLIVQCGTSAGDPTNNSLVTQSGNSGSYDGVNVDFNDVYSGLPVGEVYFHTDHLGGTALLTDAAGNEIMRLAYDTYGSLDLAHSGKLNTSTGEIERTGDLAVFAILAYRFTGQEYDVETNFFYYNARYYAPELGLFTSADSLLDGPLASSGYNRHMYVHGNPINATDPTGNSSSAVCCASSSNGGGGGSGGWGGPNSYDNRYAPDGGSVANGGTYGQPGSAPQGCQALLCPPQEQTPAMQEHARRVEAQRQALVANRSFDQRYSEATGAAMAHYSGSTLAYGHMSGTALGDSGELISSHMAWQRATSTPWYSNGYVQAVVITAGIVVGVVGAVFAAPVIFAYAAAYTGGGAISTFIATGGATVLGGGAAAGGVALASEMRAGQAIVQNAERAYTVYKGIDKNGTVRYVGITFRDAAVRFSEHMRAAGTGKEFLQYEVLPGATNMTIEAARIMEQQLILRYGLQKYGGDLLNKINSISPMYWPQYGITP